MNRITRGILEFIGFVTILGFGIANSLALSPSQESELEAISYILLLLAIFTGLLFILGFSFYFESILAKEIPNHFAAIAMVVSGILLAFILLISGIKYENSHLYGIMVGVMICCFGAIPPRKEAAHPQ